MGIFQDRLFRLYDTPKTLADLTQQVQDLRDILVSAVQDIVVLKTCLEQRGLMDEALYKELRIGRMLRDHSGAGPHPWVGYSIYPYTLNEEDFLRAALNATEAEVKGFKEEAHARQAQT